MDEEFLNNFLNDIFNNNDLIKCSDLQSMINFCRENYDNWKDIKLEYSVQIDKDSELQFDITNFNLTENVLFLESDDDNDILTLKDFDEFLDDMKKDKDDWGNIIIMCDNEVEISDEINQFPISTFVDEKDYVFCFIL
jgi:hypothetical protein